MTSWGKNRAILGGKSRDACGHAWTRVDGHAWVDTHAHDTGMSSVFFMSSLNS